MRSTGSLLRSAVGAGARYRSLLRSQYLSPSELRDLSRARLERTLEVAGEIPFYRGLHRGRPRAADLRSLPVLSRFDIDGLSRSVFAARPPGRPLIEARSSGTTGMPVSFLLDDAHQHGRFAARVRYLRAHGWHPLRRTGWLIGLRPGFPDGDLARCRWLGGASFHSHIEPFDAQLAWLRALRPHSLYTLPSTLDALLRRLEESGECLEGLAHLFTGGEVLEDSLRERARRRLGIEIADNYGATEAFLAWQCPAGSYHVNAEHVLLELVDDAGRPVAPGEMGRVLVTTLENRLMPLVRWEIGDFAVAREGPCACGRTLPLIGRVIGRAINLFRRPDGTLYSPWTLHEVVRELPEIREIQIVQRALNHYVVRVASGAELGAAHAAQVQAGFSALLGLEVRAEIDQVERIERTPFGKYMATLSEVD